MILGAMVGGLVNVFTSPSGRTWTLAAFIVVTIVGWAAIEAWRATRGRPSRPRERFAAPIFEADGPLVARPDQLNDIVDALVGGSRRSGSLVAVVGGGGFGKTTLARMASQHPKVQRRFIDCITVSLGQDVSGAGLAAKINDVVEGITGIRPGFTTAEQAAQHLGGALDENGPLLLIVDDVWTDEQMRHFLFGGKGCGRLVTTRLPDVVPASATTIEVGPMRPGESYDLLTAGIPGLSPQVALRLIDRTGHWPLLLALGNGILRQAANRGDDPDVVAIRTIGLLDQDGPTALDTVSEGRRQRAAGRTIDASLTALSANDRERFVELCIFVEDAEIPEELVARLWRCTGELSMEDSVRLCRVLAGLSLVADYRESGRTLQLHDVVRTYLRARCGAERLADVNGSLLRAVADSLGAPGPSVQWWAVPTSLTYLWRNLGYHMRAAGQPKQFADVASDLRWSMTKLRLFGAAAVSDDLTGVQTRVATALRRVLDQHGHLLTPTDPPDAVVSVLLGRLYGDPDLADAVAAYKGSAAGHRLLPQWPPPDLPDPGLRRVLRGSRFLVEPNQVLSPDGRLLLAERGDSEDVALWSVDTGEPVVVLAGSVDARWPAVFSPDGTWLAAEVAGGRMQLWDTATGRQTVLLEGHQRPLFQAAAAPDGSWLAGACADSTVRVWSTNHPEQSRILRGHRDRVNACAAAPDGSWLATVSDDDTGRIWNINTGHSTVLAGHDDAVRRCVAVGTGVVATCGDDKTTRIWDTASGRSMHVLHRPDRAVDCTVARSGTWLAIAEPNLITRWSVSTWELLSVWHADDAELTCICVSVDDRWLAAGGEDGSIHVWDVASGRLGRILERHSGPVSACFARIDGILVSVGEDGTRIWDPRIDRSSRAEPVARHLPSHSCCVSPDSKWLAVGHANSVSFWDTDTAQAHLPSTRAASGVTSCVAITDGRQLVVGRRDGIDVWDVNIREIRTAISTEFGAADSVALAGPDRVLVTGYDQPVRVYDAGTWDLVAVLDHQAGRATLAQGDGRPKRMHARRPIRRRIRRILDAAARSRLLRKPLDRLWAWKPVQWLLGRFGLSRLVNNTWWLAGNLANRLFGSAYWWTSVLSSDDGRYAATMSSDGTVRLWQTDTWEVIGRHRDPALPPYATAVLDGPRLVYHADCQIRTWSADNEPTVVATIEVNDGQVTGLAISPDGHRLCAVTDNGVVIVWDQRDWRRIAMQRIDGSLHACAWLVYRSAPALLAVGGRGVHLFALLDE